LEKGFVVGARLQAAHALLDEAARRQHQHRGVADVAQALERRPAIHHRHADVEQHHVGGLVEEGA